VAYEINNYSLKITLVAGADLSADQYKFVEIGTGGVVTLCNGATDRPIGVLQNAPLSGQEAEIVVAGGTKIVASASLAVGTLIGTGSTGKADAKTPGTDTTEYVVGTVILAAGADGEIATAVVNCAAPSRAA
jgi:hypothetical protein